ncbi:MAG: hypothetical protein SVX43_15025 [Cyanobacteriota bacterium]|nr:hypothetical protein [Cyanobacteriota bacterium]
MTKRKVEITILCEDIQQQVFARRFLLNRGFHPRKIRLLPLPVGEGSGEKYVRRQYPKEVRAYRGKFTYRSVGLVVLIDADKCTVDYRMQQLDEVLTEDSQNKSQEDERIAIFVPKRNIETWICYLRGGSVDEETAYPKLDRESDCEPCIQTLLQQCSGGLNSDAPSSLQTACEEWQRCDRLFGSI